MKIQHLMTRIDKTYSKEILRASKQYAPKGTDHKDMYQEILIAVYDQVRRRRVPLRNYTAMRNTIKQRAVEICRKALVYQKKIKVVPELNGHAQKDAQFSDASMGIPDKVRIHDLKIQLRKRLPALDAYIVMELAFHSSKASILTKSHWIKKGSKRRGICTRSLPAKDHVANLFGVSRTRVAEAMKMAQEVVADIIGEEGSVEENHKTTCQMCSKDRICQLVRCVTKHLHKGERNLTGKKGTSLLSVCSECEEKFGKVGGL